MNNCKYNIQFFAFLAFILVNADLIAQTSNNINDLFSEGVKLEWNRFYDGKLSAVHNCELQLAFDGFNCKGFLNIPASNEAFILEGSLENGNLQLVEKYQGKAASYVNGTVDQNKLFLNWQPIGGDAVSTATFVSKNEMHIKGSAQANVIKDENYYNFFIDKKINLPKTKHAKFQAWIKSQSNNFRLEIDRKIKNSNLTNRSQIIASIDHELYFESEEIINGVLIYYASWAAPKRINFVYDLKSNKEIKFDQLISNDETFIDQIKQLMFSQAKMDEKLSIEGYKEWLDSVEIQEMKWLEDGIEFATTYDPIYGKESVALDCEMLKDFVKKNYYKKLACQN